MDNPTLLRLGAAWYPEQWRRDVLLQDLRMMREVGLNAVRVGEFAWARFEPSEGRYETGWMREAMDLAHEHGIAVVLCTPTATPPAWLLKKHPDVGYVSPDGYRHKHGGRQHGDYNNPTFRAYGRGVTEAIARDLGRHPALIAWQTDNELRGHQKVSVSEPALRGWHAWLRARYGEIGALNESWGTDVWSQRYDAFEDVPGPHPLPTYSHNVSLLTNYRRYMSDSVCEFQREQVEIIRRHSGAPITHNSEDSVDEWDLTRDLDFAGTDTYVHGSAPQHVFFRIDCFRCLKRGVPFWTMETGSEGSLFGELNPEGWLACFAAMSYAGGAAGISYWPWRQQRAGAEIDHTAIVSAAGRPTTGSAEVAKVGALRRRLEPILREYRPARAEAAFVRSEYNGHYFFIERVAGLEANFDFRGRLEEEYQTLRSLGLWRDVVYDQAPLDGYRIVFSPYLPYASDDFLARMRAHLEAGGAWVAGPYCGYRERDHTVPTNGELGRLEAMLGITTRYTVRSHAGEVTLSGGLRTKASMSSLVFEPGPEDEVLGTYEHPRLRGQAWGIVRRFGRGRVYLPGSRLEPAARAALYGEILRREGIPCTPLPERVAVFPQEASDGRRAWAIVNWDEKVHDVALPQPGRDLLAEGSSSRATLQMQPFSTAFVAFDAVGGVSRHPSPAPATVA